MIIAALIIYTKSNRTQRSLHSQMTTVLDCSYQRMDPYGRHEGDADDEDEREETPQDMIIHMVEGNKARWNHIEDLDSFFTRMYHYHQKHGFACMMLQEISELTRFIFMVAFSTFLVHCVDYSVLFKYVALHCPSHVMKAISKAISNWFYVHF